MSSGSGFGGFPPGITDDDDDNNHPWVWVMIPVGLVIVLGALALCLHVRRRKQFVEKRKSYRVPTPARRPSANHTSTSHSRDGQTHFGVREVDGPSLALIERDLQESWVRGAPTQRHNNTGSRSGTGGVAWGSSRPAAIRRWDWAGLFRPEEGLNELGEAPPPYEKQPVMKEGSDVDLEEGGNSYHGYGIETPAGPAGSAVGEGASSAAHAGVEMRNMASWNYRAGTFSQQSLSSAPLGSQASLQPPPPVHYYQHNGSGIHSQSHPNQPGYSSAGTSLLSASVTQSAATTAPTSPSLTRYPSPSPGHSTIHSPAPEMTDQDHVPPPAYEETPPLSIMGTGTNTPSREPTNGGANSEQLDEPAAAAAVASSVSSPVPASASPAYEAAAVISAPAPGTASPSPPSSGSGPSNNGNNNATVTHQSPSPSAVPLPY
ncbi:hypothetical protein SMACR_06563 [Sordaria macrospora]|uniref:WGS project CABT00000000 data, contig 2.28 n=2 Tax=Sordaria macrospora TaxID=5147 RepID=F7W4P8_SORMK|nr:uncharacterized protein SMAC_06563 [Sordaria macrospora k-hell]KAA8633694.1 hypothetical protein SMACR_06563 [Sordaria macrospora]WPJ60136.1 hypothetical protein SMAC4_06563 [Sordaria macrospora]CCC12485.1 unnamed protein product [Sordaria macrospora k-hell]